MKFSGVVMMPLDKEPVLDFEGHRIKQVSIVPENLEALLYCTEVLIQVDSSWLIEPTLKNRIYASFVRHLVENCR